MIETAEARAKRIKGEQAERDRRAAAYAEKMGTQLKPSNATPAATIPRSTGIPIAPSAPEWDESKPLTPLSAKKLTKQIQNHLEGAATLIAYAHKMEAWKVLGHPSWISYAQKEFGVCRQHAYRLLDHSTTCLQIGDNPPEYEAQTRPMKALTAPQKRKAWKKAVKAADGTQPSAKQVAAAVNEIKPVKAREVSTEQNLPMHTGQLTKHEYDAEMKVWKRETENATGAPARPQDLPPAAKVHPTKTEVTFDIGGMNNFTADIEVTKEGIEFAHHAITWEWIDNARKAAI